MDSIVYLEENNKVFNDIDVGPKKSLKFAETESIFWTEAQVLNTQKAAQHVRFHITRQFNGDDVL